MKITCKLFVLLAVSAVTLLSNDELYANQRRQREARRKARMALEQKRAARKIVEMFTDTPEPGDETIAAATSHEKKWDIDDVLMDSGLEDGEYMIKANYVEHAFAGKKTLCLEGEIWYNGVPVVGIVLGRHTRKHGGYSSLSRGYLFDLPYGGGVMRSAKQEEFYTWLHDRHFYQLSNMHFGSVGTQFCTDQHPLFTAIYGAMDELLEVLATKNRDIERT